MAEISFDDAKKMVTDGNEWLNNVSKLINGTTTNLPKDIYGTQKLAFEIDKGDLEAVSGAAKVIGILGYEAEEHSLTVILVGVDEDYKPSAGLVPRQTWPKLKKMNEINDVLNGHLKP
jgi:hypothetical protein